MLKKNLDIILSQISPSELVLDIGGWVKPFNRANYVVDLLPYETRGNFGKAGPDREFFTRDTWIIHDVSSSRPLPFRDKELDFVICSHMLEDVRDPLRLCSEIIRIGKRGYIEVPSRIVESTRGLEGKNYAGYSHHRWLVEIENSEISFRFKNHNLHNHWRFQFPRAYLKKLSEEERVSFLFWEDSFPYREVILLSPLKIEQELENFVSSRKVYPGWRYSVPDLRPKEMARGLLRKYPALRAVAEKILGRKIIVSRLDESFWSKIPEIHSR